MKKEFQLLFISLWVSVAFVVPASAFQMDDYLPLTKAELGKPFLIKYAGEYDHRNLIKQIPIGTSGAEVSPQNEKGLDSLYLSGKDKAGKGWSVDFGVKSGFGGAIFTGDLDSNAIDDLLMIFPTAGNGLAPSSHVLTLLFDVTGRPIPFEAEGYYACDQKSLPELVDMNHNGKAELVFMNFDDGYWITNLYEASDGRWQRVKGQLGKRSFPLFTRFTNRPNHKAVRPARGRHPFAPDLSNRIPLAKGLIISFATSKDKNSPEADEDSDYRFSFFLKVGKGKPILYEPDDWHGSATLVLDSDQGRKVLALWSNRGAVKGILEEVLKNRYLVCVYGIRFADKLSPELIWATNRK